VLRTLIRVARPLSGSRAVAGLEPLVLRPRPHRSYAGHEADVLDVAWSRSQFLLSASMDKTVRLWHISMDDCLRVFRRVPDP
jgi:WD40 repeat protein